MGFINLIHGYCTRKEEKMKDYNEVNTENTVEITTTEYAALLDCRGRVHALVDYIEAMESHYIEINDVLRILGYSELACDREIAQAKKDAEAKGIEVPKV